MSAESFVRMLTQHGEASERYRDALARYASLKATKPLDFTKLEVLRAGRGLGLCTMATMKLRGIVVGDREVDERLASKMVMAKTRTQATMLCGSHQVCTGIRGGPEALAHCVDELFMQNVVEPEAAQGLHGEAENAGASADAHLGGPAPQGAGDVQAQMLVDAENAFPNLERRNALCRVRLDLSLIHI